MKSKYCEGKKENTSTCDLVPGMNVSICCSVSFAKQGRCVNPKVMTSSPSSGGCTRFK